MAEFRNVSGQDRYLALQDWPYAKNVADGETVTVEDDIAVKYDFDQPGVWSVIAAPPVPAPLVADAPVNVSDGE